MTGTAVVTGAGAGFGRAVADELVEHGWDVVAVVRPGGTPLDAADVTGPGRTDVVVADVRDDLSDRLAPVLAGRAVDLLVNNAATGTPGTPDPGLVDPAVLLDVLDVNAVGALRGVQAVLPGLRAAPDPLVLNVSSRLGSMSAQAAGTYRSLSTSYAYRMSKAALNMLTTCLAHDLAGQVRVWSVHPGVLATGRGQVDATGSPARAAARLRALATSADRRSPRFVDLDSPDGPDLPW